MDKFMGKRSTKEELNWKVKEISELILYGWTKEDILKRYMGEWNIQERQMYYYWQLATNRLNNIYNEEIRNTLHFELGRLEQQLKEAKEFNDKRLVLDITKQIHKLKGMEKQNIEVTGNVAPIINIVLKQNGNGDNQHITDGETI